MNANINNNIRRNIVIKAALIGDTEMVNQVQQQLMLGLNIPNIFIQILEQKNTKKKWILKIKVIK